MNRGSHKSSFFESFRVTEIGEAYCGNNVLIADLHGRGIE